MELLATLLPRTATDRPRVEALWVVNGMIYKIRTGLSWRDLPERYGPWKTLYNHVIMELLDRLEAARPGARMVKRPL